MVAGELARTIAPLRLLEREAELAALEALLGAARLGDGRLVVVEGSAGIGKTRLLAEVRALAQACDCEVLTARGGELEGEFAFGIVRQLFEAPLAAATPELRAELLASAAELSTSLFASAPTSASQEGAESSFAMLHGLYWLAANFAARRPTLLVVDDLHWADEPSLRWLHYLARRLEGLPVLLLLGTRPPEQANLPALVEELVADSAGVVMRPGGLGRESAAALARERLGGEPAAAFAAALETGSGGNPLYLVALLDAVSREGLAPTAEHAPQVLELGPRAVSYGVSTRLARLPTEVTDLLRAAAILGDRTELPLAAALAEIDPGIALTAASALVRADLLRHENPLEFTHPVVRSAVLENMSTDERTRAHHRAAQILLERGARPEQAATYLIRTIPVGDPFVTNTLRQAAKRSLGQGAPDASVAYLRRALQEPPALEERGDLLGELGIAEMTIDARSSAEHLRQALDEIDDVTRRADIVIAYANTLNLEGHRRKESADLLQRTRERLGPQDAVLDERLSALLVIACQFEPELYPIAAAQIREYVARGAKATGLMLVIGAIDAARHGDSRDQAINLGRRAIASDLVRHEDRLNLVSAFAALAMAGDVERAEQGFEHVIGFAQRRGDRLAAASHQLWRGLVRYEKGELLLAEEDFALVESSPLGQLSTAAAYRAGFLAHLLLERGEIDEAATLLAEISLDDLPVGHHIQFLYARGRVRFQARQLENALADFLQAGSSAESVEIHNPAYVPWRSQAALTLHQLGRTEEARTLAREELALSRTWGAPRTVGMSLHALGLVEGAQAGEEPLREAVEVLANSTARLEYARALVDLGALLRRENRRSEARKHLRQGVDLAHRCAAAALVARGNDELAATGAHPRTVLRSGLDELTASERRVAQMAAEDMSNKEIAQALFVTVKTVEQHLGRVYRKLDISSRRQLGTALGGPAEVRTPA
jgi:DNA-binding CsgD family transcriptional regulator